MVDFETFTELTKEKIAEKLPDVNIESITVSRVKKVNRELTGLYVMREGESVAPNIFLDGFYEKYMVTGDIEETLDEIVDEYMSLYDRIPRLDMDVANREYILENVFVSLVNRNMNEGILAESPYMDIEGMPELVGIYSVMLEMTDEGISSMRMKNSYMENIGITTEDMAAIALENTKRIFPTRIRPMEEMLHPGFTSDESEEKIPDSDIGMYVITNSVYSNGAAGILDKEKISELADKLNSNIMLVPSSTHEFIAISEGFISAEEMSEMVQTVNRDVVRLDERLSDNVFLFDMNTKEYSQLTHIDMRLDEDFAELSEKVI
jgi:hypothetical protein